MRGQFISSHNLETSQSQLARLNMGHFDTLPISFWPARTINFENVDRNRVRFHLHRRVGRTCYTCANGEIERRDDGYATVSFQTGISYRSLIFMIPFALIGLYFLLAEANLGGFLGSEAMVAANFALAYYYGGSEVAAEIEGQLAAR